jgi:hypothetical protein
MMRELDGLKPLQIKILMYCLGTDTADIMRPIVNKIKEIIQKKPDNLITVWNYYMSPKNYYSSAYKKAIMINMGGYIVHRELQIARYNSDCDLKKECERQLNTIKSAHLRIKYTRLADKEMIHGTPTCIIMRNYIAKLLRQGVNLREDETLWAKYSYGQLLNKYRKPMTNIPRSIQNDLFKAMDEYVSNL